MLPELLRFSSAARLLEHIPNEIQAHHRSKDEPHRALVAIAPPMTINNEEADDFETKLTELGL
jgi:hypothetical protein